MLRLKVRVESEVKRQIRIQANIWINLNYRERLPHSSIEHKAAILSTPQNKTAALWLNMERTHLSIHRLEHYKHRISKSNKTSSNLTENLITNSKIIKEECISNINNNNRILPPLLIILKLIKDNKTNKMMNKMRSNNSNSNIGRNSRDINSTINISSSSTNTSRSINYNNNTWKTTNRSNNNMRKTNKIKMTTSTS